MKLQEDVSVPITLFELHEHPHVHDYCHSFSFRQSPSSNGLLFHLFPSAFLRAWNIP